MAKCGFCSQRKGKRPCPALQAICSECCGRHRGHEIECPTTCQYLPDPRLALKAALTRVTQEVLREGLRPDDARGVKEGVGEFLGARREAHEWEQQALMAWMAFGFVDRAGERAVDRVRRHLEAGAPSGQEREVLRALAEARGSLFEVLEVRRDEGLLLRDVAGGEPVFVHERMATLQLRPGTSFLTWVMFLGGRYELVGVGTPVPPAHDRRVRAAFEDGLARRRAAAPDASLGRLTAQTMADAHRALREAVRTFVPRGVDAEGNELVPCDATYELRDRAEVEARLAAHVDFVASGEGKFAWLGAPAPEGFSLPPGAAGAHAVLEPLPEAGAPDGDVTPAFVMIRRGRDGAARQVLADVELRTVRLTVSALSREQLAAARGLLERLLGARIALCHERAESLAERMAHRGSDPDEGSSPLADLDPLDPTPLDVQLQRWLDAHPDEVGEMEERAARRGAEEFSEHAPTAPPKTSPAAHRLRPLPHEHMSELEPAAMELAARLARAERSRPGWEDRTITPEALLGSGDLAALLEDFGRTLVEEGFHPLKAEEDANTLASHVHYAANHELHHRKTFWVDETLAWALLNTELDVPGACLRLPFPCAAFVFADPSTRELADSLLEGDARGVARPRPVQMITVYVVRGTVRAEGTDVRFAFLLDRGDEDDPRSDGWPYLLARDLVVRPNDRLDAILDSRADDLPPGGPDPVFLAPEMKKLVHLTINAILYSTSRLLEPKTLAPEGRTVRGRPRGERGRGGDRSSDKRYSDEDVFHLPGTIDITSVRRLQELDRTQSGAQILRRFMVRGHWRRAAPSWMDQRLRWIEPYWKGPDMGMVIERAYRLKP